MVSIIILTYNNLEYTKLCLSSIPASSDGKAIQIIVVDNGSSDGTVEFLDGEKHINKIYNKNNLGFPKANNQGFEIAKGNYICILNNDVILTPYCFDNLIYYLSDGFDIIGPRTNFITGRQKYIIGNYKNENELNIQSEIVYQKFKNKCLPVNWIIGFCMLIKRSVIDDIGLFDEDYGLGNWEDIDFCTRAKYKGYKIGIAEDVYVHHFGFTTWNSHKELNYHKIITENRNKFKEKWGCFPEQEIE